MKCLCICVSDLRVYEELCYTVEATTQTQYIDRPSATPHTCKGELAVGVCVGAPWLGRNDRHASGSAGSLGAESGHRHREWTEGWGLVIRGVRPHGGQVSCRGSGLQLGSLAGLGGGMFPREKPQEKGGHRIPRMHRKRTGGKQTHSSEAGAGLKFLSTSGG